MNRLLVSFVIVFSLISSTCFSSENMLSTAYKHRTLFRGGYHDSSIGANTFQVTFEGNSFTSKETAIKYALVRAAEVTKNNDDNYFLILDKVDDGSSSKSWIYHPMPFFFFSYGTNSVDRLVEYLAMSSLYSISTKTPSFTLTIKTFKDKPSSESYLVADDLLTSCSDIIKQRNK